MTPTGLTIRASDFGPKETMNRVAAAATARGMAILARIDHAAAAAEVGMELRPKELLIFGNPLAGTPLMQAVQTVGIDLPLKVLVWQDRHGKTLIAYDNPAWIAERHAAWTGTEQILAGMTATLADVTAEAAGQTVAAVR